MLVVAVGEALFDVFLDSRQLGGAPLNTAVHASQLGRDIGIRSTLISRTGRDELRKELLKSCQEFEVCTEYVQYDDTYPTDQVFVTFTDKGEPQYQISHPVAWDGLVWDNKLDSLAKKCDAICFGSLAQRCSRSRRTIQRFVSTSKANLKLFDVNLRLDCYTPEIICQSCELANVVKFNEHELSEVSTMLGIVSGGSSDDGEATDRMASEFICRFNLDVVALTRGARGTCLYTEKGKHEGIMESAIPSEQADPVGAGDACSAAIICGLLLKMPYAEIATLGNKIGAHVASCPGATPGLEDFAQNLAAHISKSDKQDYF